MLKPIILTYFRSVKFPLAEATRIQLINNQYSLFNVVFWSSWRFKRVKTTILLPVPLIVFVIPLVFCIPRSLLRTYGPFSSRLTTLINGLLRCEHIITEASDVSDINRRKFKNSVVFKDPVMDFKFSQPKRRVRSEDKFRILFMSHLTKRKGIDVLCQSLTALPIKTQNKIHLTVCNSEIIPTDLAEGFWDRFENSFNGTITFKGVVDPHHELSNTDIYVYPFVQPRDVFVVPMSFLEAVCCGAIPIGPNFSFVKFWLPDEFLCLPEVDSLQSKIAHIIDFYKLYETSVHRHRSKIIRKVKLGNVILDD